MQASDEARTERPSIGTPFMGCHQPLAIFRTLRWHVSPAIHAGHDAGPGYWGCAQTPPFPRYPQAGLDVAAGEHQSPLAPLSTQQVMRDVTMLLARGDAPPPPFLILLSAPCR